MADDRTTTGQNVDSGDHGGDPPRPNPTTPPSSPSRTPKRPPRRAGATTPSKLSPAAAGATSSTALPPTTPATPPVIAGTTANVTGSSVGPNPNSLTPRSRRIKSVICPICNKNMCHEKALCGHIRWHTQEQRLVASLDIARALAGSVGEEGDQGPSKRFKVPDLNQPPPPDGEEGGGA